MNRPLIPVSFGAHSASVAAVAFDKDGTLLQSQPFWLELFRVRRALVQDLLGEEGAIEWEALMGTFGGDFDRRGPFAISPSWEEATLTAGIVYRQKGWSFDRCRQLAQELYLESNRQIDLNKVIVPRAGAAEMVRALKDSGVAVGIVTSDNPERARAGLTMIGLPEGVWDFILTAHDVKRPKPAPDMLLAACDLIGCPPSAVAVVGDSVVDLEMARAAGALAVGAPEYIADRVFLSPLADVLIDALCDIRPTTRS